MRLLAILAIMVLGLAVATPASATDEFGARFREAVPEALSDPEQALADIMPAAGEESGEDEVSSEEDESSENDDEEDSDDDAEDSDDENDSDDEDDDDDDD